MPSKERKKKNYDRNVVEKNREKRMEQISKWKTANKEKVREHSNSWRQAHTVEANAAWNEWKQKKCYQEKGNDNEKGKKLEKKQMPTKALPFGKYITVGHKLNCIAETIRNHKAKKFGKSQSEKAAKGKKAENGKGKSAKNAHGQKPQSSKAANGERAKIGKRKRATANCQKRQKKFKPFLAAELAHEIKMQRSSVCLLVHKQYLRRNNRALLKTGVSEMESMFVDRLLVGRRHKRVLNTRLKDLKKVTEAKTLVRRALNKRRETANLLLRSAENLKKECDKMLSTGQERGGSNMQAYCGVAEHSVWREPYFKEYAYACDESSEKIGVATGDSADWEDAADEPENENGSGIGESDKTEGGASSEKFINLADIVYPIRGKLLKENLQAAGKELKWPCDERCSISADHERLVSILRGFAEIEKANIRSHLEHHNVNECSQIRERGKQGHLAACLKKDCDSNLFFLRRLSVHYPSISSLLLKLYSVLRLDRRLTELDRTLLTGRKGQLKRQFKKKGDEQTREGENVKSEDDDEAVPEKVMLNLPYARAFQKKLEDIPESACACCEMLNYRDHVVKVVVKGQDKWKKGLVGGKPLRCKSVRGEPVDAESKGEPKAWNALWEELHQHLKDTGQKADEFFVCRGCRDSLDKGEQHNARSVFNDLKLDKVPPELAELNDMETMLVQQAKCFQTVVRLGTVSSKLPASDRLQVIKGQVLHYPLPLSQTMEELDKAEKRPSDPRVHVLINGVPTKNRIIWQSLVSVDKVKKALIWLKGNNVHYENIVVDDWVEAYLAELEDGEPNAEDLELCKGVWSSRGDAAPNPETEHDDACSCHEDDEDVAEVPKQKQKPILKKVDKEKEAHILDHYTIHPLYTKKSRASDLELFELGRVEAEKIDNREETVDVKCFPKLYPTGRRGKGQLRRQPLRLGDFLRTRFYNKDGRFRRDAQYIFNSLHDYELRSVASGVFQCQRSSRIVYVYVKIIVRSLLLMLL